VHRDTEEIIDRGSIGKSDKAVHLGRLLGGMPEAQGVGFVNVDHGMQINLASVPRGVLIHPSGSVEPVS
jgi:hypothetical protein